MNLSQFYINGKWVDPFTPETLDVINPATEESIASISIGSSHDVDNAVIAARNAFKSFSKTTVKERIELLTDIRNIYKKRFDEIADAIMTENKANADIFTKLVDSAIVMVNASTQFADGGEFGLGAEIGISTGRLHARGPVSAEQLTSFKYVVHGNGQIRA